MSSLQSSDRETSPRGRSGWGAVLCGALLCALLSAGCGDEPVDAPGSGDGEPGEELSGGETTVFDTTRDAFARPAKNLSDDHRDSFSLGDHFFNRNWITAPASASGNDGLGPVYNATSCSACHFRDGRAAPPQGPEEELLGLVIRLSVPGKDEHGAPVPEPSYGRQFNQFSILGVPSEGRPSVEWEELPGAYPDGEPFSLRRPVYSFPSLGFGPLDPETLISGRIARQLIGLGLLEAIPEATVLALADEDDADGDGISGRPNYVWDPQEERQALGRFGWKASRATVEEQLAGAFHDDIGVTSALFPEENCLPPQLDCLAAPTGGSPEIDAQKVAWMTLYMQTIAVPARRQWTDPEVVRGKALFQEAGCTGCHRPVVETGPLPGLPELEGQLIRPYTDLLLHDMGEGLADGRPDHRATGREWRTPPLWGIGLVETVNKHTFFLNDGRARGFAEAILWHAGEAAGAQAAFVSMPATDRRALIAFLESL